MCHDQSFSITDGQLVPHGRPQQGRQKKVAVASKVYQSVTVYHHNTISYTLPPFLPFLGSALVQTAHILDEWPWSGT